MITKIVKNGKEMNMLDFKADLGAFSIRNAKELLRFQKDACLMLLLFLKAGSDNGPGTPVDTRWANNNWWFAVGPSCPREPIGSYPGEGVKLDNVMPPKGILAGAKPFQMIWVYNNVEYIEALEDGHSKQAPSGFAIGALQALEEWLKTQPYKVD